MHLERTDCCNNNYSTWLKTCSTAFNIKELFCTKVSCKTGFGNNIVAAGKGTQGCVYTVTAMGNICKRSTVNKCRILFKSLNQIWFNNIFEQSCNGTGTLKRTKGHVFFCVSLANYNAVNSFLKLAYCTAQADNCHNFTGNCNCKMILAWNTLQAATKTNCNIS